MPKTTDIVRLAFCTAGIYAAYLTQGLVQERLSTTKYEPDEAQFKGIIFLNLAQSISCFVYAALVSLIFERGPKAADSKMAKFTDYILPSLTNSIGPALGVQALKNISYPAQVLAKSCKMIPVMIVGTILHRKRYSLTEYLCAFFIAGGISIFALFKQSSAVLGKLASPNAPLGYALVFCNLFMDGYTNSFQDDLKARKPDTSAMQFMCWINFWCSVFSGIYQFGFSDIGMSAVDFLTVHPAAVKDVLLFCACGVFGQCIHGIPLGVARPCLARLSLAMCGMRGSAQDSAGLALRAD
ncbi:hypothetical protein CYMTET_32492 [Cymbomonas tetramitiformis]|uniref:UAA transporter n=1 Tax=Cymbomonas tetramitiformis TaxID=36881 RepID=A0AAE0FES3_9CHLO|nr:hypothetical protein CYMTET_32492 [Cymbomonas tetramitiformis]